MQDPNITSQTIKEHKKEDETILPNLRNNSSDDEIKSQIILFLTESTQPSDPLLKSVIKINIHYSKKYSNNSKQTIPQQKSATDTMFHNYFTDYYTLYKKIKEEMETNKIDFDEKLLIKMIGYYPLSANKQLPSLIQFIDDYIVIKTHFIFSDDFDLSLLYPENDPSIVEQISKHNQALRVPQATAKKSKETKTSQNALVCYITALEKFQSSLYVEAETFCMASYHAGVKSAVFLQILTYHALIDTGKVPTIKPEDIQKYEQEAVDILSVGNISKFDASKIIYHPFLSRFLTFPTVKAIKIFSKLLEENSFEMLQSIPQKIWHSLMLGKYSIELVNRCTDITVFKDLAALFRQEGFTTSYPADPSMAVCDSLDLTRSISAYFIFKKHYLTLSFQEFYENMRWLAYVPTAIGENGLTILAKEFPLFLTITKIISSVNATLNDESLTTDDSRRRLLQTFFKFLINEAGAELREFLKKSPSKKRKKVADNIELLSTKGSLYISVICNYYPYFKKAGFSVQDILQLSPKKLQVINEGMNCAPFLFEKWEGDEIQEFIASIRINGHNSNKSTLNDIFWKPKLLKDSQGNGISYQAFKKLWQNEPHEDPQEEVKSSVAPAAAQAPALSQMGIFSPSSPKRPLDSFNNTTVGDELIKLSQKIKGAEMHEDFAARRELLEQLHQLTENALNSANKRPKLGGEDEK